MGKKDKDKKNKTNSLTEDEKILIKQYKVQLQLMGVPREHWAKICQEELGKRRASENTIKKPKLNGAFGKAFEKVSEKLEKGTNKLLGIDKMEQD